MKIALHIIKNEVVAFKALKKDGDLEAFIEARQREWGGFYPVAWSIAKKLRKVSIYWCTEHSNFKIINVR